MELKLTAPVVTPWLSTITGAYENGWFWEALALMTNGCATPAGKVSVTGENVSQAPLSEALAPPSLPPVPGFVLVVPVVLVLALLVVLVLVVPAPPPPHDAKAIKPTTLQRRMSLIFFIG